MPTNELYSLKGKRVWVTGHRGMVGSAVVRRLTADGWRLAADGWRLTAGAGEVRDSDGGSQLRMGWRPSIGLEEGLRRTDVQFLELAL